jgi:hypothetical protein
MRTVYRLFDDDHGYVTNILCVPGEDTEADNFLYIEILEFLIERRKQVGDVGMEGYYFVGTVEKEMERLGYPKQETRAVLQHAYNRNLIVTEYQGSRYLEVDDQIAVHGSGFIHSRFLLRRLEYVAAALPVTSVEDKSVAQRISNYWNIPPHKNDVSIASKIAVAELFLDYLKMRFDSKKKKNPYFGEFSRAGPHMIKSIEKEIEFRKNPQPKGRRQPALFDRARNPRS